MSCPKNFSSTSASRSLKLFGRTRPRVLGSWPGRGQVGVDVVLELTSSSAANSGPPILVEEREVGRDHRGTSRLRARPCRSHLGHRARSPPRCRPARGRSACRAGRSAQPGQLVHVEEPRDEASPGQRSTPRSTDRVARHPPRACPWGRPCPARPRSAQRRTADQAERRLDADDAVLTRRADDLSVGPVPIATVARSAETPTAEPSRSGTGCGPARVLVVGLSADRGPSAGRVVDWKLGPLGQVRLASTTAPLPAAAAPGNASRAGVELIRAEPPAVVHSRSRVSTLSSSRIGVTSSDERAPEWRRCLSLA